MLTRTTRTFALAAAALFLCPAAAWAHPGHDGTSFGDGLAHPLTGLDHAIAMVAVGLWSAQMGGRARWALPAAFIGVMLAGGALGASGAALPLSDTWIAVSVLIVGALIAAAARLPMAAALPIVGAFALAHGFAHGAEKAHDASFAVYAAGFAASTALLHGVGIAAASWVPAAARSRVVRGAGLAFAAAGAALLVAAAL